MGQVRSLFNRLPALHRGVYLRHPQPRLDQVGHPPELLRVLAEERHLAQLVALRDPLDPQVLAVLALLARLVRIWVGLVLSVHRLGSAVD